MCLRVFITDFYQPLRNLYHNFILRWCQLKLTVLGIHRVNDLKTGTLIGTDKYGNKYYEDKRNFFGMWANTRLSNFIDCVVSAGDIELAVCLTCVSLREGTHRNTLTPSASVLLSSVALQTYSIWLKKYGINLSQSDAFHAGMPIW